ncbi:helix-turn-helix domain-containing protein [Anaerobacillus isosaccharinicus]|uniref:Helix-turn-helix domain-containing protein n=1 Tax=Anaerobacillus isosaccharinicus TaxID=1532552 RepID=A0A1S2LSP1_9BACI|nr:helix-turn-helix domain-containing protein [Anaerobacillus isosaccharinicus]MBA5584432.1 helix-turn-helix domain-containing protein [Anaerobacillus isosaccharinicus]QOY37179.1 helix-turn-helix domain-containing protein [Anaerobacillus isosaccharinicus]
MINVYNLTSRNLVGDRIRQARHKNKPKLTQSDLLARLAVRGMELEKTTISKIEAKTRPVTDIELVVIADALGVSILWLLNME